MQTKTLLLVDADGDCQQVVSQAAGRTNYKMLLARTGAEAFEIIRQKIRHLDLIIIDIDPGVHGPALLEAITACAERPPTIVVTALEEVYMGPIAAERGAATCLGKPLRLPRLLAALRDISLRHGLTCNRWGSLVPPPVREPVNGLGQFRGIAAKLSPSRTDRETKSRK
jgi:DNA-binding NtrC family response regulator